MLWYFKENEQTIGPITDVELQELVANGKITLETQIKTQNMREWKFYKDVKDMPNEKLKEIPKDPVHKKNTCCECNKTFNPDELVKIGNSNVCASCKPILVQRIKEGAPLPGEMHYAGFWVRFKAKFIDGLILWVPNFLISSIIRSFFKLPVNPFASIAPDLMKNLPFASIISYIINIIFALTYYTWFIGKFAATPGKMVAKIKIVTSDGGTVSYKRAFGRYFAEMLSSIIFGIGYLMVAFDKKKRALHDRICNTSVVYKNK